MRKTVRPLLFIGLFELLKINWPLFFTNTIFLFNIYVCIQFALLFSLFILMNKSLSNMQISDYDERWHIKYASPNFPLSFPLFIRFHFKTTAACCFFSNKKACSHVSGNCFQLLSTKPFFCVRIKHHIAIIGMYTVGFLFKYFAYPYIPVFNSILEITP